MAADPVTMSEARLNDLVYMTQEFTPYSPPATLPYAPPERAMNDVPLGTSQIISAQYDQVLNEMNRQTAADDGPYGRIV